MGDVLSVNQEGNPVKLTKRTNMLARKSSDPKFIYWFSCDESEKHIPENADFKNNGMANGQSTWKTFDALIAARLLEYADEKLSAELRAVLAAPAPAPVKPTPRPAHLLRAHAHGEGTTYIFECPYDDRDMAKDAGFQWNGSCWSTDRPGCAVKLIEYAASPEMADELRAAVTALPNLLRPAGKLASSLVTDIKLAGGVITADFPERHDGFLEVIKDASYHWTGVAWIRTMTKFTGAAEDRMAELASALLEAGFKVRIHNAVAEAKVLAGEYEPEQTRWLVRNVRPGHDYDGWFRLMWGRNENLYESANSLPGARWRDKMMLVPPAAFGELMDYAGSNGFAVTDAAKEIVREQEAAIIGSLVVTPVKRKARAATHHAVTPKDAIKGGMDPELMDEFEPGEMPPPPQQPDTSPSAVVASNPVIDVSSKELPPPHPGLVPETRSERFTRLLAVVRPVFGDHAYGDHLLEGLAEVAEAWPSAKFVELVSTYHFAIPMPPTAEVNTPWGRVVFITQYFETSYSRDGEKETARFKAPVFPRESGFTTSIMECSGIRAKRTTITQTPDGQARTGWRPPSPADVPVSAVECVS
jgi:hypothetical protein